MCVDFERGCKYFQFSFFLISGNQGDASAAPQSRTLLSSSSVLSSFFFPFWFPFPVHRQEHLRRIRPDRACCSPPHLETLRDLPLSVSDGVCLTPLKQPRPESRELQRGIRAAAAPRNVSRFRDICVFRAVASAPASHQTHSSTLEPLFWSAARGSQSNQTDEQSRKPAAHNNKNKTQNTVQKFQ